MREKDRGSKAKQAAEYNRRHGVRSLPDLEPGTRVLVHDQIGGEWNVPATVDREIQPRSYRVVTESGGTLRRNRHDLRLNPEMVEGQRDHQEANSNHQQAVEGQRDHQETNSNHQQALEEAAQQTPVRSEEHIETRTRYGRLVKTPQWRKDYV